MPVTSELVVRTARLDDIGRLAAIENLSFTLDRLSRRNFRYLLTRANAVTLVAVDRDDTALGYVTLLFHAGTSLARLYSYAVLPDNRKRGLGARLVQAAERAARARNCVDLRLETRADNRPSIELFRKLGYRQFAVVDDYYEDHAQALRFEKGLIEHPPLDRVPVPYYRQTLDFTCGPAALMMAMKSLRPEVTLDRRLELRLWREATSIFMTSNLGGCDPYGLALAAHTRGFDVSVYASGTGTMLLDTVRSEEKKAVMRLVQQDFVEQLADAGVPVLRRRLSVAEMQQAFAKGAIAVVLISSYRIYREKSPHWVVVTGFDDKFIYVHDPYFDEERQKSPTDRVNLPILKRDFERMARYGRSAQRAAVVLRA